MHTATQRPSKPPPAGPAPPAPASVPPNPPTANGAKPHVNGVQKGKKKADTPIDRQTVLDSVNNRIATLQEEKTHADEEEARIAEEAQKSVHGLAGNAIQKKYVELYSSMKRLEQEYSKEKQKLQKDKDTSKSQLTKANQMKAKMENVARDLNKENRKLRDENSQLLQDITKGVEEIRQLSAEIAKGKERARQRESRNRELPDIVVKVVCKYRAELFFKISRKTKLSRLFTAWSERMETNSLTGLKRSGVPVNGGTSGTTTGKNNDAASVNSNSSASANAISPVPMSFVYTHQGKGLDPEMTVEEAGIEDADEILAVELMDLTGPMPEDAEDLVDARLPRLKKNFSDNPAEAKRAMEEVFDGVTRERLKLVLRQYELRERHFECFIRSKELELMLARYREAEQRHVAESERIRVDKLGEDCMQLKKELDETHNSQTLLIEKLIQCCKEPNAERTQRLFSSLREELEKRGAKMADGPVGG